MKNHYNAIMKLDLMYKFPENLWTCKPEDPVFIVIFEVIFSITIINPDTKHLTYDV